MTNFISSTLTFISPDHIIASVGLLGVIAVVFAESGLFFGFFLPGDSLLFTAGFLASQSILPLPLLLLGVMIAAIAGDSVGYAFGRSVGQALFSRPDSRWLKRKHLEQAKNFYETYGPRAIVFARFIPVVRTFAPIVAGVAQMKYRTFLTYNILGGILWSLALICLGYFFGQTIPNAQKYVTPIVILIVIVSILPGIIHLVKNRLSKNVVQ